MCIRDRLKVDTIVALNMVGAAGGSLLGHFGKGFEPDEDAFDGLETEVIAGVRILKNAIGYLVGKVVSRMITGDHVVYLLEISEAGQADDFADQKPMVHIRKSGGHY